MVQALPPDAEETEPLAEELRDLVWWHGTWAGVVLAALLTLLAGLRGLQWAAASALLAGSLPGLLGVLLRSRDSPRSRALLLAAWAGLGALACMLTGGLLGPLAVWCLAPFAVAAVIGGSSLMAEAAALSLAAAAVSALVGLAGFGPPPPPPVQAFWLGFVGISTTGFGLGAGLLLARRRAGRKEAARREEEAAVLRVLDEQPHLILTMAADGRTLSAHGRAPEGLAALSPGGRLVDHVALNDRGRVERALLFAGRTGQDECAFAPARAAARTVVLSLRGGSDGRLIAVLRDATAERAREAALEAAREEAETLNAGKSRFLANMSHELRTPLNAIMGFSDVMRSALFGELQPKYAEYADMIHESGRHLLDLINDVLDISKIEADRYELSRERFDAREAISSALRLTRLQADAAGVSQRGLLPPGPLEVDADRRAIKQIVLNLVSNAVKFTPRGGAVTVTAQAYGETLEIVVSDTGVGIAEADVERLGRPYEQAGDAAQKVRGTGLGLSLVRSFAELHGGSMSIESRLGEGTSVTVRMPVLVAPKANGERPVGTGAKIIAFNPQRG